MNADLQAVREEIKTITSDLKTLNAKVEAGEVWSDEEFKRSEEGADRLEFLQKQEEQFSRSERIKSMLGSKKSPVFGAPTVKVKREANRKDIDNAILAWMFHGHQRIHVQDSWKRSCELVDCNWESQEFFCRAQSTDTTNHEGEELLNGSVFQALVEAKAWEGSVLQYCDIINSPIEHSQQPIHFATSDDTGTYGAYKKQNVALTQTGVTYDRVTLNDHMVTTAIHPVSIGYLLNPNTNVLAHLNKTMGTRLRRTILRDITSADGTAKPTGFLQNVVLGHTGLSNNLTPDDIRAFWYSIDPVHRNSPNFAFVGHDNTVESLENSLVDATSGIREWGVDLNSAPTDSMRGKPFVTSNWMPQMASGQARKAIVAGDFSAHKVRFVGSPQLIRDDSRLVDTLSVFFAAYQLVDSNTVNAGDNPLMYLGTGTLSGD